jgi:GT2 family glycosyltransferase
VERASTPFVAFADDDSWWAPGSLRAAADALDSHPDVGLVTVATLVGPNDVPDPFTTVLASSPLSWKDQLLPGPRVLGFMGCAAMVRRNAFLQVGGFDDVVRFPGEEQRLAWDLTSQGWPLVYLSGPLVHHHPSPRREAAEQRRRGLTRARVLTAVMRLPWPLVRDLVRTEVHAGPAGRRGVVDSLVRMPSALSARRVVPPELLTDLAQVAAGGAPRDSATARR